MKNHLIISLLFLSVGLSQKEKEYNGNDLIEMDNGLWTYWYDNGMKELEVTYKDGKVDGLYTEWYENGQKRYEVTYKDGELVNIIGKWNKDGSVKE